LPHSAELKKGKDASDVKQEVSFGSSEIRHVVDRICGYLLSATESFMIGRRSNADLDISNYCEGEIVAMSYALECMFDEGLIRHTLSAETVEEEMLYRIISTSKG
jgi:hypothetical protein